MTDSDDSTIDAIWIRIDKMALILAVAAVLILTGAYFVNAQFDRLPQLVREFISSLITNFIPILGVFVISYILFREFQRLRAKHVHQTLAAIIAKRVIRELNGELQKQHDAHNKIGKRLENLEQVTANMTTRLEKRLEGIESLLQTFMAKMNVPTLQDLMSVFMQMNKLTTGASERVPAVKEGSSTSKRLRKMENS
jgi:hypothetical protein